MLMQKYRPKGERNTLSVYAAGYSGGHTIQKHIDG